ncbi:hypothetical protein SELMODRAFT_413070 [Selaginella moellendorffii]|uniref:Uncharacterized protein n=1 Tax=Selaginella moellendorffii TaxID=88036 RepID=D8RN88_SELML|nr:hypothetical protein SELMODRAFT_413070 [Selaginella moellendorffii]
MEGYLDHLRSLRRLMNDYEDKAAVVSAERHKQEAVIRALEKDLECVNAESRRLDSETDGILKQSGFVSASILRSQRELSKLDKDAVALADALEVLKKDTVVEAESIHRKKAHFDELSSDFAAKFELYKSKCRFLSGNLESKSEQCSALEKYTG